MALKAFTISGMTINFPDCLSHVIETISADHTVMMYGSAISDSFLQRRIDIVDLATDMPLSAVASLLKDNGWIEAEDRLRTPNMVRASYDAGAASKDSSDDGLRLRVRVRHVVPNSSKNTQNFESILANADFTINAMGLLFKSVGSDEFVDPYNGLADFHAHRMVTVGSASHAFADKPIRIWRMCRTVAESGFDADADMIEAACMALDNRAFATMNPYAQGFEFQRLILSDRPTLGLRLMEECGLMAAVIPELQALKDMGTSFVGRDGRRAHHKDNWEHSLRVLDHAMTLETDAYGPAPKPDLTLRLAALFHDVGKATTKKAVNGKPTFRNHAAVGAKLAENRLLSLGFSWKLCENVTTIVRMHMDTHSFEDGKTGDIVWSDAAVRRLVNKAGPMFERLIMVTRSDATGRHKERNLRFEQACDDLIARARTIANEDREANLRPELDGHDVMDIMGWRPGKRVGRAVAHMLAYRKKNGEVGREKAVIELGKWASENIDKTP